MTKPNVQNSPLFESSEYLEDQAREILKLVLKRSISLPAALPQLIAIQNKIERITMGDE